MLMVKQRDNLWREIQIGIYFELCALGNPTCIVYLVAIDGIPWGNFEGAVDYIQPAPHRVVGKRIMILVEQKNLVD